MRRLTDISPGSVSLLLPIYSYYSVLVSDTFLVEATNRLSDTFLVDAIGRKVFVIEFIIYKNLLMDHQNIKHK